MKQGLDSYMECLEKHRKFLKNFKTFPSDKCRKIIYREVLQIPLNHQHLHEVTKAFPKLPEHTTSNKQLQFVTSTITSLYPDLSSQWIPSVIHPFVKLFHDDTIVAFQCSLTFLCNWFFPIFENYPSPSEKIMDIFIKYLPKLNKIVNSLQYPLSSIIQPMLSVAMTDVLNRDQWLQVFDFLVTYPFSPWFYLCIGMALLKSVEEKFCRCQKVQQIAQLLRREKSLNVEKLISEAKNIGQIYKSEWESLYKQKYFPISQGKYPLKRFRREKMRFSNSKFEENDKAELVQLKKEYEKFEVLLERHLTQGLVRDRENVDDKYELVEGQMREYIKKVRQEHSQKIQALRQIEQNFKQRLNDQGGQRSIQENMETIQRRARLQKEIQRLMEQANSIKRMEENMMDRINDQVRIREKQIQRQHKRLRRQRT